MPKKICKIEGCSTKRVKNGLCTRHLKYPDDDIIPEEKDRIIGKGYKYFGKIQYWNGTEFYFKCDQCNFETIKNKNLTKHIKRVHDKNIKIIKCYKCNYKTKIKDDLIKHNKRMHNENIEKCFQCNICDYKTKLKEDLQIHAKRVHNESNELIFCELCNFKTTTEFNLINHKKMMHENIILIKCDKCDFTSKTKFGLERHNERIHIEKNKVFKCNICKYQTKIQYDLASHKKRIHSDIILKCNECKFECKNSISLKYHVLSNHNNDAIVFYCSEKECTFNTKIKQYLSNHLKHAHDIGKNDCNFCFKKCYKLNDHTDNNGSHKICKECYKKITGYRNKKEKTVVEFLKKNYHQYMVSNDKIIRGDICTKYRPDVLYTSPNRIIIIEIDEYQHLSDINQYDCEEKRLTKIQEEFGGIQTVFIRFNPDEYITNGKNKNLKLRLKELLEFLNELENTELDNVINLYYMYYNEDNEKLAKNISYELIH